MSQTAQKVAIAGISVAAVFGLAVAFSAANDYIHPAESGAQYLREKGYTNVTGGTTSYFNTCGEHTYARKFEVTNTKGKRTTATVCYGLWKYESLI